MTMVICIVLQLYILDYMRKLESNLNVLMAN